LISSLKHQCLSAALIGVALGPAAPERAKAVTLDIARKCKALTNAAYPLRVPGNPAAGTTREPDEMRNTISRTAWQTAARQMIPLPSKRSD
jgi:hypothetical protein